MYGVIFRKLRVLFTPRLLRLSVSYIKQLSYHYSKYDDQNLVVHSVLCYNLSSRTP